MKKKIIAGCLVVFLIVLVLVGINLFKKNDNGLNLKDRLDERLEVALDDNDIPKYVSGKFSDVKVVDTSTAYAALDEVKELFKINNVKNEFNVVETKISDEVTYYEFQQKYNNVLVMGGKLTMSVSKDGEVLAINGTYVPDLKINVYGLLSEDGVKSKLNEVYGDETEYLAIDKYIEANIGDVVYYVSLVSNKGILLTVVSARDGSVISEDNLLDSADYTYTGKGLNDVEHTITINEISAILGNMKSYEFVDNTRNIVISDASLRSSGDTTGLVIEWAKGKVNLNNYNPISVYMNEDNELYMLGDIQSLVDTTKNAVTAMSYYEDIYDYYKDVLGRDSYDNKGSKIIVNLNVSGSAFKYEDLENAFWLGTVDQMFIGNKGSDSYAVGKDILAHEFTHGVISYTAGLTNVPKGEKIEDFQSRALNEAYADILGSLIENKNWFIGEDLSDGIIRDLTNPESMNRPGEVDGSYYYPNYYYNEDKIEIIVNGKTYESIGDYDSGGAHHNANIVGHTAYLMEKNKAFSSKEEMAKVWYNSLFLLSAHANFEDCAYAVIQAAINLGIDKERVSIIRDAFIETKMLAQEYYDLSGKVTDEDDKGLESVLVTAINAKNAYVYFEVYSDEAGDYSFTDLPKGEYTVSFEKAKYYDEEESLDLKEKTSDFNVKLKRINEENYKKSEIVFVMDNSLSMDDNDPLDIRKKIISNVLNSLNNDASVALITFTKDANVVSNGLKDDTVSRKMLITDVFNLSNDNGKNDNSGTNGVAGIASALELLNKSNKSRKYIVFLTDGDDTIEDSRTYDELIVEAKEHNVRILTIGLGNTVNSGNLQKLANETDGKYYQANSSSKLYKFDKRIFEELS